MVIGDIELQRLKDLLEEKDKYILINDDDDYNKGVRDGIEEIIAYLESRNGNYINK